LSVIIKVYSNHTLSFDNYTNGIELIEEFLNTKIKDSENREIEQFNDEHKINYFTNHNYFEQRYKENWGIWVYSNYNLCKRFVVHKHFVQFDISGQINLTTHIWQKLIAKQYDYYDSWNKTDVNKTLNEWNDTRKYIADITQKLGGDRILYLNDGSISQIEELIWDGAEISSVIHYLNKISKLDSYADLESNFKKFSQDNGFIETLK
jgi:hypothetical protein